MKIAEEKKKNRAGRPDQSKNHLTDKGRLMVPAAGLEDERFARYEGTYRGTDRNG
jgi:hypothetical protein